jgi:hypothetical protein
MHLSLTMESTLFKLLRDNLDGLPAPTIAAEGRRFFILIDRLNEPDPIR